MRSALRNAVFAQGDSQRIGWQGRSIPSAYLANAARLLQIVSRTSISERRQAFDSLSRERIEVACAQRLIEVPNPWQQQLVAAAVLI